MNIHEPWITLGTIMLTTCGLLAELNLMRALLSEWCSERGTGSATRSRAGRGALAAIVVGPALWAAPAHAQGSAPPAAAPENQAKPLADQDAVAQAPAPAATESAKSPFSLQLNLDFTNEYFYHGILQQDEGLIVQPALRLTLNIYTQDDFKIDALLGTWNSFGPNSGTQTGDLIKYWYESDLIAGFVLAKGDLSLTTTYTFLTSPADAYQTVQELDFNLAYDDTKLLDAFALHPYALLGVETGANGSDGADTNPGTYLELGVAPGLTWDIGNTPVALSLPVSVGLSLHDYYQSASGQNDTYGFTQVGLKASVPLPFGDRYGKWTLNAGVFGLFLGGVTSEINHGDRQEVIGTIGLQVTF